MSPLNLTSPQWEAVRQALDQFVSNGEEAAELGVDDPLVAEAATVLDAMNAAIAALASRAVR